MESIFLSFIEDNFLSYIFYKYKLKQGFYYLFLLFFDNHKFQNQIIEEINGGDFFHCLYINQNLLNYLHGLQKNNCKLVLISHHNQDLVETIKTFFGFDKALGNENHQNYNCYQLMKKNYPLSWLKSHWLVTDNMDLDISLKTKGVIMSGPLIKNFFNCVLHKNVIIIPASNTYNRWLYNILIKIKQKAITPWWYLLCFIMVPLVEIFIVVKVFFSNVFIILAVIFLIKFNFNCLSIYDTFPMIMDTNNFINIYNIINSFWPQGCPQIQKYYLDHGVLKSFGSFSMGIFLFSFVNFLYFNNKFSLAIQMIYIVICLKYSIVAWGYNKFYMFLLFLLNGYLCYFFN
jgi:hypothetical protein